MFIFDVVAVVFVVLIVAILSFVVVVVGGSPTSKQKYVLLFFVLQKQTECLGVLHERITPLQLLLERSKLKQPFPLLLGQFAIKRDSVLVQVNPQSDAFL